MAMVERELPKQLYVAPTVHWRASLAAAMLKKTLKEMTEEAIADIIAKYNLDIPEQPAEFPTVTK